MSVLRLAISCVFGVAAGVANVENDKIAQSLDEAIIHDDWQDGLSLLQVTANNFEVAEGYEDEFQPGTFCTRGARVDRVCCGARCGSCGGEGCQNRPGGGSCCTTQIERRNRRCTGPGDSNCMIPRRPRPPMGPVIDDPDTVTQMAVCDSGRTLDLAHATVTHSNLGGRGPDVGDETLVYSGVFPGINLVVSATSTYTPNTLNENGGVHHNGLRAGFGVINMACDGTVDLLFRFEDASTGGAATPAPFLFTWFDSDHGMAHASRESISVSGFASYHITDNAALDVAEVGDGLDEQQMAAGQGAATFTSTMRGGKVDNPVSPLSLTRLQSDRAVVLLFQSKSEFAVTLSETGYANPQGRNFLFSGSSAMICPDEAKCSSLRCPDNFTSRMNAEFLVCAGRPCSVEVDRDTCCYADL